MSVKPIKYQRDKNSGELYATPPNGMPYALFPVYNHQIAYLLLSLPNFFFFSKLSKNFPTIHTVSLEFFLKFLKIIYIHQLNKKFTHFVFL